MKVNQEFIENVVGNLDIQVRDYSGRGMYGAKCFAIVGKVSDLVSFAVNLPMLTAPQDEEVSVEEGTEYVDAVWFDIRSDNMGLDMVYYWPGVQIEE